MALHGTVVASPSAQFTVAGVAALAIPSLPFWMAATAAIVPTIYYTFLTIDYIRNWKPPTVQRQTVGAVLAKVNDLIGADRPYLVAFAIAGVAAANAFGLHIPDWVYAMLGAGGLISVHRLSKANVVIDRPAISVTVPPPSTEGKSP